MGFDINPYDPCVANKIVNGIQMTVTWHMDNLKVSHKDPSEVSKFIQEMGKIYCPDITVTRGMVHSYLGMNFDYSTHQSVEVLMIKYAKQISTDSPDAITGISFSPGLTTYLMFKMTEKQSYFQRNRPSKFTITWVSYYSYVCKCGLICRLQFRF